MGTDQLQDKVKAWMKDQEARHMIVAGYETEYVDMAPYEHDCDGCGWVGWFAPYSDKPPMNIYVCASKPEEQITVVIRFSSDPPDYWSSTWRKNGSAPCITTLPKEMYDLAVKRAARFDDDE